jgi:serine/threonine protein kinase
MHKLKVVHRDLRPEHIMFDSKTNTLKVADFGCAAMFSDHAKLRGVYGSPFYIAPEMTTGPYN